MTSIRSNQHGYVALIAVLITGAIATAIAMLLLVNGNDLQRSAQTAQQSVQARGLANACAEEALQLIHDTTGYTGTGSLTLGQGTCTYTVTNTGTSTRTITTTGTVQSVVRKVQAYVTIGTSSISVTSWQEVA